MLLVDLKVISVQGWTH